MEQLAGGRRAFEKDVHPLPMGEFSRHNSYHHVHNTYTLLVQRHVADLARGIYSSVRVPVSACLGASENVTVIARLSVRPSETDRPLGVYYSPARVGGTESVTEPWGGDRPYEKRARESPLPGNDVDPLPSVMKMQCVYGEYPLPLGQAVKP